MDKEIEVGLGLVDIIPTQSPKAHTLTDNLMAIRLNSK